MKKIFFILLFISSLFGQEKERDWSNIIINYPLAKDDSSSFMYADSGETMKSLWLNRYNRAIRIIEDKIGLGNSNPSAGNQVLTVASDGFTTTWAIPTSPRQWQILAPTIAYQRGDSLLFVKSIIDENVYYDLGKVLSAFLNATVIDSIWMLVKGDAASYIDSIKIYSVADNLESNMAIKYSYTTPAQCNGSNQTRKYPINVTSEPNQPLLLRVWYNVTSYVYTMHFRIFAKST